MCMIWRSQACRPIAFAIKFAKVQICYNGSNSKHELMIVLKSVEELHNSVIYSEKMHSLRVGSNLSQ